MSQERICPMCQMPLPSDLRADAVCCSQRCRKRLERRSKTEISRDKAGYIGVTDNPPPLPLRAARSPSSKGTYAPFSPEDMEIPADLSIPAFLRRDLGDWTRL